MTKSNNTTCVQLFHVVALADSSFELCQKKNVCTLLCPLTNHSDYQFHPEKLHVQRHNQKQNNLSTYDWIRCDHSLGICEICTAISSITTRTLSLHELKSWGNFFYSFILLLGYGTDNENFSGVSFKVSSITHLHLQLMLVYNQQYGHSRLVHAKKYCKNTLPVQQGEKKSLELMLPANRTQNLSSLGKKLASSHIGTQSCRDIERTHTKSINGQEAGWVHNSITPAATQEARWVHNSITPVATFIEEAANT